MDKRMPRVFWEFTEILQTDMLLTILQRQFVLAADASLTYKYLHLSQIQGREECRHPLANTIATGSGQSFHNRKPMLKLKNSQIGETDNC